MPLSLYFVLFQATASGTGQGWHAGRPRSAGNAMAASGPSRTGAAAASAAAPSADHSNSMSYGSLKNKFLLGTRNKPKAFGR